MCRPLRSTIVVLGVLLAAATVSAQGWRGQGRLFGRVTDEAGRPLEGVIVKLMLPAAGGGTEVKTSKKGDWALAGIAGGTWQIDFVKTGYETRQISVEVQELTRLPSILTVMKKAVDPNAEILEQLTKAADLVNAQKFSEARAIYEAVLAKYPQAHKIEPYIARTYYAEGQYDKAIEHLRIATEKDPENVEAQLLLGNVLVERGSVEEGQRVLASIDEAKVKDPIVFLNIGIALLNKQKAKDALPYFEKTVSRFPAFADGYYYRGLTNLQLGTAIRPDNQAEGDRLIQAAKADLSKFLEMAPNAPEAATAKKLLEQLK